MQIFECIIFCDWYTLTFNFYGPQDNASFALGRGRCPFRELMRIPAEGPLRLLYPLLQSIARRLDRLRPQIPRGVCVLVSDEQVCCRPAQHRLIVTARHKTTQTILLIWPVRVAILAFRLHYNRTCSVVVSALASINVVNRHWARLVLGWVTACGRVNHLGM